MMKGPSHHDLSLCRPVSSWILWRTISPMLKDLVWMLWSWYHRMFWRYRVDRSKALHLISSSESSSIWRLSSPSVVSYISSRGDFHMMSAGSIASEPYTRKKGVCPVALLGWVRSPQIIIGSSASHMPLFLLVESKILFFSPSIISPLMRSTWPLALGCATDTYLTSMQEFSQ